MTNRESAWCLLTEFTQSESLRKHALAVEACMRACSRKYGDGSAGFITAVALIKPGKSLAEVDAKSVRKRMKDKAFARKVNRDDIVNGAKDLGVDLDEHIQFCIEAMKPIAEQLGLDGSAAAKP